MPSIPIKISHGQPGIREATPPWLTDTDIPAPCPCGQPFEKGASVLFYTSRDTGLKRIFHIQCAHDAGLISFEGDD